MLYVCKLDISAKLHQADSTNSELCLRCMHVILSHSLFRYASAFIIIIRTFRKHRVRKIKTTLTIQVKYKSIDQF